jgi:hypothetical protein
MKRASRLATLLACTTVAGAACAGWISVGWAQIASTEAAFGQRPSFRVDKSTLRDQGASAALIEKVDASAFRYFRLLARQFAARTCFEFRELRWRLPFVAVHGDAHIEQFVITEHSYGLEDFDQAGFGPLVVDVVRYAASIHVACRQAGFPCDADAAVSKYFDAYHAALDQPVDRMQPAIVGRLYAAAPPDAHAWLQWAESLMQPLPSNDEQSFRQGWGRFVQLMRETTPEHPDTYYQIARVGGINIGVGSALEPKILIRIAGPTDIPDDDLMLEARNTVTPTGQECVSRPANGGSLQVLMFASLLGPRLPEVFGFLPREGAREAPELWVQSWDRGYRELSIADLRSQTDLNELAVDAGTQLAGHFWTKFPEPLRAHQRFAQLRAFEMTSTRATLLARTLADETIMEWERFRRQR